MGSLMRGTRREIRKDPELAEQMDKRTAALKAKTKATTREGMKASVMG